MNFDGKKFRVGGEHKRMSTPKKEDLSRFGEELTVIKAAEERNDLE